MFFPPLLSCCSKEIRSSPIKSFNQPLRPKWRTVVQAPLPFTRSGPRVAVMANSTGTVRLEEAARPGSNVESAPKTELHPLESQVTSSPAN